MKPLTWNRKDFDETIGEGWVISCDDGATAPHIIALLQAHSFTSDAAAVAHVQEQAKTSKRHARALRICGVTP